MKYIGLQFSRFLAAIWVLLYHMQGYHEKVFDQLWGWNSYGNLGVDFFFCLSGFVMVLAHRKEFGDCSKIKIFCYKRIIRVYPILWFFAAAQIFYFTITKNPDFFRYQWILKSLFLLPDSAEHIVNVAWSLRFEMMFYFVFITFFFIRKKIFIILALILWSVFSFIIDGSVFTNALLRMATSPFVISFCMGALASLLYFKIDATRKNLKWGSVDWTMLMTFFLATLLLFIVEHGHSHSSKSNTVYLIVSLSFSSFIYLICFWEKKAGITLNKYWGLLGDSSYVLYLLHSTVIANASLILGKYSFFQTQLAWGVMVLFIIIISLSIHIYIEKPMVSYFRKKLLPR